MMLVLGYRVLANTGRYWGGSGIERYFFDCETRYPVPISAHAARRWLLSKPQSNSSRRRAAATMQHKYLDLLANNSGRKSGVGRGRQEAHL